MPDEIKGSNMCCIARFFRTFVTSMPAVVNIERHPWQPFIPPHPRLLMLGTFPPKPERWSMDFYYPNKINDMWRLMGYVFYGDRVHFWNEAESCFQLDKIKTFLNEHGIALWDTAMAVRRLKGNASDKFLDIVEPIDLAALLKAHPTIAAVATAGEKATGVIAAIAGCEAPGMGRMTECEVAGHEFALWRMPSSSRAYPLSIDKKAAYYRTMMAATGIL